MGKIEPGLTLLEAMLTQRAVRRLRPDPVPPDVIESMIFYATRAPSGANRQPWEFVVVTDSERRARLGEIYRRCSKELFKASLDAASDDNSRRVFSDAIYLSDHMGEAPVLVVVCARVPNGESVEDQLPSIYPAVQNLLLCARAHRLGTVLTDAHRRAEDEVKTLLAIPAGIETVCIVPIGYPQDAKRAFRASAARRPLTEVIHWEGFDRRSQQSSR